MQRSAEFEDAAKVLGVEVWKFLIYGLQANLSGKPVPELASISYMVVLGN
jgi:hypothetical protein